MVFGTEYGLKFCGWRCSEFWLGKPINRWYLDLVVQHLHCINACATNCTTSWNQKLWCDTPQTCSLMHSIKKVCFLFWTNLHYLSRVGDSFPSSAPSWLRVWDSRRRGRLFLFHFPFLFHRYLDISWIIAAARSPLHLAGSRTWTENFWFPNVSR